MVYESGVDIMFKWLIILINHQGHQGFKRTKTPSHGPTPTELLLMLRADRGTRLLLPVLVQFANWKINMLNG